MGVAPSAPSLACVSRAVCPPRGSGHGHGHLAFGFLLLYPWLSGYRAGVHTHTAGLEALSQSWLPSCDVGCRLRGTFSCLTCVYTNGRWCSVQQHCGDASRRRRWRTFHSDVLNSFQVQLPTLLWRAIAVCDCPGGHSRIRTLARSASVHQHSVHLEPAPTWPRSTYVWVFTLVPVAQGLQGGCAYPYCRAGSPEPVVVTL